MNCTNPNCGRPEDEHAREYLSSPNPLNWKWRYKACPIGETPFHPEQTYCCEDFFFGN
jgi:hypothetical protein